MFYKEKFYSLINWKNRPNLSTPLGAKNLNKMDKAIGELDERVVETSIEAEKNKLSVQNLGLEIESVSKDIEEVRESTQYIDSSKIVTNKSGAPVYIDDASNMNIENIVFYGESKQETTNGNQLLKPLKKSTETIDGIKATMKDGYVVLNGTNAGLYGADFYVFGSLTEYEDTGLPEGTYIVNAEAQLAANVQFIIVEEGGVVLVSLQAGSTSKTFQIKSGVKYRMAYRVLSGGTANNYAVKIMLNKGTAALPWEKYSGGKPAPNPDYPQMIESSSVGSVRVYRKNLLKNTGKDIERIGLTYTMQSDGSVKVVGTMTEADYQVLIGQVTLPKGSYILSGAPSNICRLRIAKGDNSTLLGHDLGSGFSFTLEEQSTVFVSVRTQSTVGTNINAVYYPMIRPSFFTDGTYEPYESQFASLTSSMYFLGGIGDVRDTIEIYKDGSGKYIQRIGKIYTKNVSSVYSSSYTNPNGNVFIVAFSSWEKEILWTHRNKGQSVSTLTKDQYYVGQNENSASGKVIYFISDATTTASALAEIKAENSEICYILLNPIETALSTEEMNDFLAMLKLHTYKPNTIVDAQDTLIDVQYVADTKAYIDKKFRELATVIVNQ